MPAATNTYDKYVTEDLKVHKGLLHPRKATMLERLKTRMVSINKLHPNPEDEFSVESVGPNWEIVGDYERSIRDRIETGRDVFGEPLIAVKLDKGGYMLLNGHHRWLAAINVRVKKVPVKVVNITTADDIYKVIDKSERTKCVTIDFDEVLFADNFQSATNKIGFPLKYVYKKNIRDNASLLIREFQNLGFDVWIYSGGYLSEQYINGLFKINKCKIDGMVNGLDGKRNSQVIKKMFRDKYNIIAHVDNESVTIVCPQSKNYEILDINCTSEEWAAAAVNTINDFDFDSLK